MEERIESLRKKYEGFKKGEGSILTVRDQAHSILQEARNSGNQDVLEEVEDKLMDLEFSIEENKCKCHRKTPRC